MRITILEHSICGHQHETIQLIVTAAKEQHHLDGTGTVAKGKCTVAMLDSDTVVLMLMGFPVSGCHI